MQWENFRSRDITHNKFSSKVVNPDCDIVYIFSQLMPMSLWVEKLNLDLNPRIISKCDQFKNHFFKNKCLIGSFQYCFIHSSAGRNVKQRNIFKKNIWEMYSENYISVAFPSLRKGILPSPYSATLGITFARCTVISNHLNQLIDE